MRSGKGFRPPAFVVRVERRAFPQFQADGRAYFFHVEPSRLRGRQRSFEGRGGGETSGEEFLHLSQGHI